MDIKTKIGVAPMRLQTPELHDGHIGLINTMLNENDHVVVLLGTSQVKLSDRNTYNFEIRRIMLNSAFNHNERLTILPLADVLNNDIAWSQNLDRLIGNSFSVVNPCEFTLYGSRDSFIPYYHGIHPVKEIPPFEAPSGTDMRKQAASEILDDVKWRKGVIYGAQDRYPISYTTIDAVIMSPDGSILLGRKPHSDKFCFIGGFVEPQNPSLEDVVIREIEEETTLVITEKPMYIFSHRVEDARYARERDKIMTTVFLTVYEGDKDLAVASDDLVGGEVKWFEFVDLTVEMMVPAHQPIMERLIKEYFIIPKK